MKEDWSDEMTAARFILRPTTPAKQRLGGTFELVRAAEPDKPLQARALRSVRGGFEVEMLEPLPELKLTRQQPPALVGGLASWVYKLQRADVECLAIAEAR